MAAAMVQVNVRIPPELHAALLARAGKTETTVTDVVRIALERFLANDTNGGTTK